MDEREATPAPGMNSVTATSQGGALLAGRAVVFAPTIVVFLATPRFFLRRVLQGSIKV